MVLAQESFITFLKLIDENGNPATGKSVTYTIYDESQSSWDTGTMDEITGTAIYYKAWTPDADGYWIFHASYSGSDFKFYDLKGYQVGKGVEDEIYERLGAPAHSTIAGDIADLITRAKGLDAAYDNVGDFAGQTNLTSLLAALGIPDVAGKSLYTVLVTDLLENATYGLSALNDDLDDILEDLGNWSGYVNFASLLEALGIPDVAGKDLYTILVTDRLDHATYGLSALHTDIEAIENKVKASPSVDSIFFKAGGAVCPAAKSIWDALGDGTYDLNNIETDLAYLDASLISTGGVTNNNGAADGTTVKTGLADGDDYWNGQTIIIRTGACAGQSREITDFSGGTITVSPAFDAQIVLGVGWSILPTRSAEAAISNVDSDLATHDADIKADLGDFSGQTNLQSLLAVLGVPDVAGKSLYTCLITDRLDSATFGLSALNDDLDSIISELGNGTYGLAALKAYVDSLETWLGNPSGDTLTTITAKLGDNSVAIGTVTDRLYELVQTSSTLTGTPTVNFFDTNLTEATDDHYNGSIIIFTSGNLAGQASIIVGYDGTTKEITVNPAFIEAPSSGNAFVIVSSSLGSVFTGAKGLEQVYDAIDTRLSPSRVGDTTTADGSEQVLYIQDNPDRIFKPNQFIINVTNMQAGDTTVIRVYYRIKEGGNYVKHVETTYADDEDPDLKNTELLPNVYGVKITLEQSGGVNRDYDWEVHMDE